MRLIGGLVLLGVGYYAYQSYIATTTTPMTNEGDDFASRFNTNTKLIVRDHIHWYDNLPSTTIAPSLGDDGPPAPLAVYEGTNPITWEPSVVGSKLTSYQESVADRIRGGAFGL